jgi:iron complex outermembrane receptor protein
MKMMLSPLSTTIAVAGILLVVTGTVYAEDVSTTPSTHPPSAVKDEPVAVPLTDIEVVATRAPEEGSAEKGYRVDRVRIPGSLGSMKLLDTPYSVNVLSEEFLENQQVQNLEEALKFLPSTQFEQRFGPDVGRSQTRGFQGSVFQNNFIDGLNIGATTAYPMEQFERVEVVNGLSGALFGPANPSGIFNYVLKRPTEKPLYRLSLGYDSDLIGTVHADVGGRAGKNGWFGYRVNMLFGDGIGYVEHSNLRRGMASVALDIRPFKNTTLELNYSYIDFMKLGYPGAFSLPSNVTLPEAPDPTRVGYGQKYTGMHLTTQTASIRFKPDPSKIRI